VSSRLWAKTTFMKQFLSCDWGTTSFRLRLIEAESLAIIDEEKTSHGIAQTFQLWKQSGENEESRLAFYLDFISKPIKIIEKRAGISLSGLPLIISGMASSTIGMIDLSYKDIPIAVTGEDVKTHTIDATNSFQHTVLIISGVRTADDVIRGEETKLIGCASGISNYEEHLYIFPGTHPKHIEVKNGKAAAFKTYMTGEFFELLSKKSILSVSVKEDKNSALENNLQSFEKGVKESINTNLLHGSFLVRTNDLFKELTPEENYYYLSGLLIGAELKDVTDETRNITIVGNAALATQYLMALNILGLPKEGAAVTEMDADEALIKGQIQVYKKTVEKA